MLVFLWSLPTIQQHIKILIKNLSQDLNSHGLLTSQKEIDHLETDVNAN